MSVNTTPIRILHLEDDPRDSDLIQQTIRNGGLSCVFDRADSRAIFESALEKSEYDVILVDYNLPAYDGLTALMHSRERQPNTPVIVISGALGEETAVKCLQFGARDYLLKQRLDRLPSAVTRTLEWAEERRKRIDAEKTLRESEERFRQLAENSNEGFWLLSTNPSHVLYANPAAEKIFGIPMERFYQDGNAWEDAIHPEDKSGFLEFKQHLLQGSIPDFDAEYRLLRPDGSAIWVITSVSPIRNAAGEIVRIGGITRDINARKRMEEEMVAALREKEVMLGEIHHRVKNNLQVISSMLSLQVSATVDARDRAVLQASRDRVRSMSLIQEFLYKARDYSEVDFGRYIQHLVSSLGAAYEEYSRDITFTFAADLSLPIGVAIPCGLIINELVTNVMKHAFPDHTPGTAAISMERGINGMVELRVTDSGIGLPVHLDIAHTKTLGLQLVETLVNQIGGIISVQSGNGTAFIIQFHG